jgi:hypothetical protein
MSPEATDTPVLRAPESPLIDRWAITVAPVSLRVA